MEVHEDLDERRRLRVCVLEARLRASEVEVRTSRETLMRLMEELQQERRRSATSTAARQSLQVELEGLAAGRRSEEQERRGLEERLEAGQRVVEAAARESRVLQGQVEDLEVQVQGSRAETQEARRRRQDLLEKLAKALLLPGNPGGVEATEAEVLHRVEELCAAQQDAEKLMETRLSEVREELGRRSDLQAGSELRARRAEDLLVPLGERLQGAQTDLQAAAAQRDALRRSTQHYEEFLKQLMATMKIDGVDLDLDLDLDLDVDMRLRLIRSRAEQLIKQEGAAVAESRALSYSLQRKLKQQKERLESKELHTDLLRKKVQEKEEQERRSRSALAEERDGALAAARRLHRKLERLQSEMNAAKTSAAADSAQLKLTVAAQSERLQQQKRTLETLAEGKTGAEERLRVATSDLQGRERRVASLSLSLAQLSERERELVDFRMVVSHMLGLQATPPAAAPNDLIIQSLDALLHPPLPPLPHHHHHHHLHHHPPLTAFWSCPEPHAGLREVEARRGSAPAGQEENHNTDP